MSGGAPEDAAALAGLSGRRYWRALDELVERPEWRQRLADAFPGLARPGDWRRRDLLKCLGGALAIAGLDGCERVPDEEALPYVEQSEDVEIGIARHYATAVEMEGVAHPVIGKTREGRPIKLEGNPAHPASRGASDPFVQAALLDLYDPARSAAPRHRGLPTSWTQADTMLAELRAAAERDGGAGFRLVTGAIGSPTLLDQIAALLARWPAMRWHVHAPAGGVPAAAPVERLRLDRAHVVVAFDADLLGPGPLQTWHASAWGARRRAFQKGDGAARLLVAEPVPTITGVTAGERLPAAAGRMHALLAALAARLDVGTEPAPALGSRERQWVEEAAAALAAHSGAGLVAVGAGQHAATRRLALAIDARLGNLGKTRSFVAAPGPAPGDMAALKQDMAAGRVARLFVLDANPVYSEPGFAALMDKVPWRGHAGRHVDETARRSHWHLPTAHLLESWSDGRAADGSAVLVQPLVRPWLAVRSRHALVEGLLGGARSDRAIVQERWAGQLDEAGWRAALLAGLIPDSGLAETTPEMPSEQPAPAAAEGIELLVRPDPSVWDGRFASNPWLQELPKPLTKLTWGNAIHLSPALAREHGLETGDRARLWAGARSIEGPVWVLPGQDRRSVLVHLGYGRTAGGPVAEGVGFDATPLLGAAGTVRIERIEGQEDLATTQHHFAMEDDEFVRFVDTLADALPAEPPRANFYPPQKSSPAWGMAIDLDLCIGCNACVVACVAENNIPMVGKEQVAKGREMHWIRVDRYYSGPPEDPEHAFQPVPCMHCEDAPCEMGCPVNAAVHSPDGLNLQVYNRCIGTRTCSAYCPYKVRRFNWFDLTGDDPPALQAVRNPEVTVRGRGVMEKCTYCIQRISSARIAAKKDDRPIADGEVQTACQAACPTQAIVFGDVADADTAVSARKASGRDYDLLPDTNTRPRTTYQARIRSGNAA